MRTANIQTHNPSAMYAFTVLWTSFDIFQKVIFYLALYTEEVNLQTFVMI